jgi:fructose-1,6-bisphosphatase I
MPVADTFAEPSSQPDTFSRWLAQTSGASTDLQAVLEAVSAGSIRLSERIARGTLAGAMGEAAGEGENAGGDAQKALDVFADEVFISALRASPVRDYASEEQNTVMTLNPAGTLALATDPLDGSSNIDVNVSIGTIFSIFPVAATPEASFLRPGHEQVAGGYVVYGPQTTLVLTLGRGVAIFILDRARGEFLLAGSPPAPAAHAREYAINASNARHWGAGIAAFIAACEQGKDGPLARDMNMRWVGSLVAETHRILMRGGVFLYPGDRRSGYEQGRLRRVYECAPIAFVIEQAGGAATDGLSRLLDATPDRLHARCPFVFGNPDTVADIARMLTDTPSRFASTGA